MTTAAEILARLEIARYELASALELPDVEHDPTEADYREDRIEHLIAEIVGLRHRLLVARHETNIEMDGRRKTVREWLIRKEEMSVALDRCRAPAPDVAANIAAIGTEIELQVQLSNATVDIDGLIPKPQTIGAVPRE